MTSLETVPFLDLKTLHAPIKEAFLEALSEAIDKAEFVGGSALESFEATFAEQCEIMQAIGLSSGTDALVLALRACGVGPGKRVVTVPNTFIATCEAITQAGGDICFVDIEPDTCLMDPDALARFFETGSADAVIPVHLYGQCADMDRIGKIAAHHGARVIEDAAQAHGARYRGRHAGSLAELGCFSFYPGKNLGSLGEGGAVTTNDADMAAAIRRLRDHGQSGKYVHQEEGFNARMHAIQARFLSIKLAHLETWNQQRRDLGQLYDQAFTGSPHIRPILIHPHNVTNRHLYVIHVENRDALAKHLAERGIQTGMHYPIPAHLQPCYMHLGFKRGDFPKAEASANQLLSLPLFPGMTEHQLARVVAALRDYYA